MRLEDIARQVADLIWHHEQRTNQPMEEAIVTYIRDAVRAEIEYRRRMVDLDRRLAELEGQVEQVPVVRVRDGAPVDSKAQ
jgi:hypothetical protein